jgi:hypothetical protein
VMSGRRTYKGAVLWVSTELCVVEEERRAHRISETTWTTTGDLEPPHGHHATSQCAKTCELLVACAIQTLFIHVCTGEVVYTVQRIAHVLRI